MPDGIECHFKPRKQVMATLTARQQPLRLPHGTDATCPNSPLPCGLWAVLHGPLWPSRQPLADQWQDLWAPHQGTDQGQGGRHAQPAGRHSAAQLCAVWTRLQAAVRRPERHWVPSSTRALPSACSELSPSVCPGDARVDARSTVIIRCILSMQNETMQLRTLNPALRITTDASYHDMYYMGWGYGEDTLANHLRKSVDPSPTALYDKHGPRALHRPTVQRHLGPHLTTWQCRQLMRDVFDIAGSLQGHQLWRTSTCTTTSPTTRSLSSGAWRTSTGTPTGPMRHRTATACPLSSGPCCATW